MACDSSYVLFVLKLYATCMKGDICFPCTKGEKRAECMQLMSTSVDIGPLATLSLGSSQLK